MESLDSVLSTLSTQKAEVRSPAALLELYVEEDDDAIFQETQAVATRREAPTSLPERDIGEMLHRIQRLERAVFDKSEPAKANLLEVTKSASITLQPARWTSFCSHSLMDPLHIHPLTRSNISRHLPAKDHLIKLLNHYARSMQPTFGVLHMPSIRGLVEQTYEDITVGKEADAGSVLLLLAICASCALTWNAELLEEMDVTSADAKVAFRSYCDLFNTFLDGLLPPLAPSTVALEALLLLTHLQSNTENRLDQVYSLKARALWMTRALQIHRLDTWKSRERRRLEGCNQIEIEVQRRIWWYMVATDCVFVSPFRLGAFSGGSLEGTYVYHPSQMRVNYPLNRDDDDLTTNDEVDDQPLSVPTSISQFILRVRLAEICREAVDTLPSIRAESQSTNYDTVLALHGKFQEYIQDLPIHFRLDDTSIQQSEEILNNAGSSAGLRPSLYCLVIQHVFMAAMILATDISFDPESPEASSRKAEVLAACDMLEVAKRQSLTAREYIELNIRKLRSLLKNIKPQPPTTEPTNSIPTTATKHQDLALGPRTDTSTIRSPSLGSPHMGVPSRPTTAVTPTKLGSKNLGQLEFTRGIDHALDDDMGLKAGTGSIEFSLEDNYHADWDQVWDDFYDVAPELDLSQWNVLFDTMDSGLGVTY
ncbi:putative transcription factor lepB [Paramyrothecium foliicola]|nr:putative transcription factor lepB [Paramyrothecium foliicola]